MLLQEPELQSMANLGRIKPQTKMACPNCRTLLGDFSIEDVAEERAICCPSCDQQLRLPEELVARAKRERYLGQSLDITC